MGPPAAASAPEVHVRAYAPKADFEAVSQMLVASHRPGAVFDPWLQPRWEYMHFHPLIRGLDLSRCGVAEEHGEIVGVICGAASITRARHHRERSRSGSSCSPDHASVPT